MKLSKKRKEYILGLCNDISENMPLSQYTRKDFVDAIAFWQDEAEREARNHVALESTITIRLAELLLQIKNKEF
jgi:hypothetical protein